MTREEYAQHVRRLAIGFLSECDAAQWKAEHAGAPFQQFEEMVSEAGRLHTYIDAHAASSWEEAVEIIRASQQDPDDVDCGLYEGCNWKTILVVIAFELLRMDVLDVAEELFNNVGEPLADVAVAVVPIRNTSRQWGFAPALKVFRVPVGPNVLAFEDFVKIYLPGPRAGEPPRFSVVFEGRSEKHAQYHRVHCRRVYVQHDGQHIDEAMKRCTEEFGVVQEEEEKQEGEKCEPHG